VKKKKTTLISAANIEALKKPLQRMPFSYFLETGPSKSNALSAALHHLILHQHSGRPTFDSTYYDIRVTVRGVVKKENEFSIFLRRTYHG
jgi:hypothetical protein